MHQKRLNIVWIVFSCVLSICLIASVSAHPEFSHHRQMMSFGANAPTSITQTIASIPSVKTEPKTVNSRRPKTSAMNSSQNQSSPELQPLNNSSKESSSTETTASPESTPKALPANIENSFVHGKYVLGKSVHKNGWHRGEPVTVVVDKASHYTYVFQLQPNDTVVEVLRASNAVGSQDMPTPYGHYKVVDKLKWPSWIPPKDIDPKRKAIPPYNKTHRNPLGVARIGLDKFGINLHGTNDPHSLRHNVSHGCIRHSNADILKIFNMVNVGSTVIITRRLDGTTLTKQDFLTKAHATGFRKAQSKYHRLYKHH